MSAEFSSSQHAIDLNNRLSANRPAEGSSSGGGEQQQSIFQMVIDAAPSWVFARLRQFGSNTDPSAIEQGAPGAVLSSKGAQEAQIQGMKGFDNSQGNFIWRALKMVFSDRSVSSQAEGVGGEVHSNQPATPIEAAPPQVAISDLMPQGSMGSYSVADITGGGNITPIGPMQQGGNYLS